MGVGKPHPRGAGDGEGCAVGMRRTDCTQAPEAPLKACGDNGTYNPRGFLRLVVNDPAVSIYA